MCTFTVAFIPSSPWSMSNQAIYTKCTTNVSFHLRSGIRLSFVFVHFSSFNLSEVKHFLIFQQIKFACSSYSRWTQIKAYAAAGVLLHVHVAQNVPMISDRMWCEWRWTHKRRTRKKKMEKVKINSVVYLNSFVVHSFELCMLQEAGTVVLVTFPFHISHLVERRRCEITNKKKMIKIICRAL